MKKNKLFMSAVVATLLAGVSAANAAIVITGTLTATGVGPGGAYDEITFNLTSATGNDGFTGAGDGAITQLIGTFSSTTAGAVFSTPLTGTTQSALQTSFINKSANIAGAAGTTSLVNFPSTINSTFSRNGTLLTGQTLSSSTSKTSSTFGGDWYTSDAGGFITAPGQPNATQGVGGENTFVADLLVTHGANVTFTGSYTNAYGGKSDNPALTFAFPAPVSDTNEFVVGTGTQGQTATTTINMTQSPNHIAPNWTPEITALADNAKGLITITNLATTGRNELLVWSSLTLEQLQAINPAFAAVEPQWSAYGALAELALPVGASTYTVAYDLKGTPSGTLNGVAVVPEPASLGLLVLGAFGLLGKRRSK